ncbi:extracellular solute-binding protein [Halioxenophilus aromaticivorans]|uniref:Extracellular solute-binding protein n=1 Tax=Halioxenophilus aromaticivorans TaxID=1306992 RepID=A0AAV3U1I0_9ALTE
MTVKNRMDIVTARVLLVVAALCALAGCGQQTNSDNVITVYTARNEQLIKPLFDQYSKETGVEIRYITDDAGPLLARLKAEGENTPADLFITVDAGFLWQASEVGVLAPVDSQTLLDNIPAPLRSQKNDWYGLSLRARTIVYATDRVKPEDLSTYEALAEAPWNGRLCLRTSKKVYNQSLVATMIKTLGEPEAERIVGGWVKNLATAPYSNDVKAMEAVAAGQCDATIVNTYYFGRLHRDNPDINLAIFWPNQDDRGVHINVSGAGVTKYAKNPEGALKLLEWLSQSEAQYLFAEANQEYPVNPDVKPSEEVQSWGEFKPDSINVEAAGRLQAEAIKLMDRVGYQ